MKPYFVFARVWHNKCKPYDVSSYQYYVVAKDEVRAKQLVKSSLEVLAGAEFGIDNIEEIDVSKGEQVRHLITKSYDDSIKEEALEKALEVNHKDETKVHEASHTCSADSVRNLIDDPNRFYLFVKDSLKPNSKVFISNGQMRIYSLVGPTFYDREFLERKRKEVGEILQIAESKLEEARLRLSQVDKELKKNDKTS